MPELPDVEVFRRHLDTVALDRSISAVNVLDVDILRNTSANQLESRLKGHEFVSTARHGKHLFIGLEDGGWLALHFGMTGYLQYLRHDDSNPRHTRVLFGFADGHGLAFVLQRRLGSLTLTPDMKRFVRAHELGPDALDESLGLEDFEQALRGKGSTIKSALMDQSCVAGIGNIYSDEVLFQAKVHPRAMASQLDDETVQALFASMKDVLAVAIDCQAQPARFPTHYLLPHRYKEGTCPVCHSALRRVKISGRTSYYCPGCQGN